MDARQRELDDRAITLIAKRQPMANDLRAVVGSIRMAGDLERIGDLAKNIAKRVGTVGLSVTPHDLSHSIDAMAQLVLIQVQGSSTSMPPLTRQRLPRSETMMNASTSNTHRCSANF